MNRYFCILLLFLICTGCSRSSGFILKKILSKYPNDPKWEVAFPQEMGEVQNHLDQPYTYLGSGNHCYVFMSTDGEYVLKFFKQKHMRIQSMLDYLPLSVKRLFYPMERLRRRTQEREESFTSYKIAYEQLQEETGVVFLHLNKTVDLLPNIALFDQHGTLININLDNMEFLLQKKATLTFEHLNSLFDQKEDLLDAIKSLLCLVSIRSQKGIYDQDLQLYKNFGFHNGYAIEVDVGEFKLNKEPHIDLKEVREVSLQIRDFIHENAPELLPEVQAKINSTLKSLE